MNDAPEITTPRRIEFGYALPGLLSWSILVFAVLGTVFVPRIWIWVAVVFVMYFIGRMVLTFGFAIVGERRVRAWQRRDWVEGFDEPKQYGFAPADVHHVVIVPNYKEPAEILRRTLDGLARQHRAAERVVVILGMEEREAGSALKGGQLVSEYEDRFLSISYTLHPGGLPGEEAGKSSNEAWAGRQIMPLIDELGLDADLVTVSSCDADSVFHDDYFAAVAQMFAADEKRYEHFWQAPLLYYNNIWQVPAPVRLSAWFTHTLQYAELAAPFARPLPISTYTFSARLGEHAGWWDPGVIPEDWHTFLNAQFAKDGDVRLVPVWLPTHGDAVDGDTWFGAIKNRNAQLMRHAWGAEDVGWIVDQMAFGGKPIKGFMVFRFGQVLHDHVMRCASWFVLMSIYAMSFWYRYLYVSPLHYRPMTPELRFISVVLAVGGATIVGNIALEMYRNPPPEHIPLWKIATQLFVLWISLPLVGFFLGMQPALSAQTRLMFGIPIGYKVTPKRLVPAEATSR